MEQIEKIIQLVTNRVIEQLEQPSAKAKFAFMGEPKEFIVRYFQSQGYEQGNLRMSGSVEVLVITEMTLYMLTRLAQLAPNNSNEEAILDRLMKQESILVLEEGMDYNIKKVQIPKIMQSPFEKAKVELKKWGMKFVNQEYFQESERNLAQPLSVSFPRRKELITATKIQNMHLQAGDIFEVTSNMIVTALAKDYLHDQNIIMEVRDAK